MNISQKLEKYRGDNGLSQDDMAKKLGLKNHQSYQYYVGLGDKFSIPKAKEFGEKLGINLLQGDAENIFQESEQEYATNLQMETNLKGLFSLVVEMRAEISAHTSALAEILAKQSGQQSTAILAEFQRVYRSKLDSLRSELKQRQATV